jgi:hypothetical protein
VLSNRGSTPALAATIAAIAVFATSMALGATAAAKPTTPAKPNPPTKGRADLKVTELKFIALGSPPHIVIGTDGEALPFEVLVKTTNVGDAVTNDFSETAVTAQGQGQSRAQLIALAPVPRLQPGQTFVWRDHEDHLKLPLGFTKLKATADDRHQVHESNESNNVAKVRPAATIPFQWNADIFATVIDSPAANSVTNVQDGFNFTFKDAGNGQFVYEPHGDVVNYQTSTPESACQVSGQSSQPASVLTGDNGLFIDTDLKNYEAIVPAEKFPKYFVTLQCIGGFSFQEEVGFEDLQAWLGTGAAHPSMSPGDPTLKGSFPDPSVFTTWSWSFSAALPK